MFPSFSYFLIFYSLDTWLFSTIDRVGYLYPLLALAPLSENSSTYKGTSECLCNVRLRG